ncbi:MAG: hypothetical protein K5838_04605 [Elusimicrobiales bacterium]|nr:hypothetical protein [Elusimicrobiales bacterium]
MKINIIFALVLGYVLYAINSNFLSVKAVSTNETPYYEQISIDYIVPSPGYGQKAELEAMPFIDKVIPYYFTAQTFLCNGENFDIGLHIVETDADINNTPFAESLLIEGSLPKENEIIIDYRTAKAAKAKAGDNAEVYIGNAKMSMRISGIVQPNKFTSRKKPSALIYNTKDVKKGLHNLTKYLAYSGAYIKAKDAIQTGEYLEKKYKAKGEIGDISWYEDKTEYEHKKKSIENADFSREITDVNHLKSKAASSYSETTKYNSKNILYAVLIEVCLYFFAWIGLIYLRSPFFRKRINSGVKTKTVISEFSLGEFICCALNCGLMFSFYYSLFPKEVKILISANVICFLIVLKKSFAIIKK